MKKTIAFVLREINPILLGRSATTGWRNYIEFLLGLSALSTLGPLKVSQNNHCSALQ